MKLLALNSTTKTSRDNSCERDLGKEEVIKFNIQGSFFEEKDGRMHAC